MHVKCACSLPPTEKQDRKFKLHWHDHLHCWMRSKKGMSFLTTPFSSSFRLGWASWDPKAVSPIQMSWLKIVLFFMRDPSIFAFYPSVDNLTPCPDGSCLSAEADGVPVDAGDVQLLGQWFASACHSSGAPWQPVLGGCSHFIHSCFPFPIFRTLEFTGWNNTSSVWQQEVFLSTPITC